MTGPQPLLGGKEKLILIDPSLRRGDQHGTLYIIIHHKQQFTGRLKHSVPGS